MPISAGKAHVLVVDDEDSVRVTTAALLEDSFEVDTARSGEEAMVWLRTHEVDVVCADFRMPGMTGLELLEKLTQRQPDASGVLVTGHRDFLGTTGARGLSYSVLLKPYQADELIERVKRAAQLTEIKRSLTRQSIAAPRSEVRPTTRSAHAPGAPAPLALPRRRP
jgi:DNA-binding NtrC family response regulator